MGRAVPGQMLQLSRQLDIDRRGSHITIGISGERTGDSDRSTMSLRLTEGLSTDSHILFGPINRSEKR